MRSVPAPLKWVAEKEGVALSICSQMQRGHNSGNGTICASFFFVIQAFHMLAMSTEATQADELAP